MSVEEPGFTWDELAAAGHLTEVILDHDHVRGIFRMPQVTGISLFMESLPVSLTPELVRSLVADHYLDPSQFPSNGDDRHSRPGWRYA